MIAEKAVLTVKYLLIDTIGSVLYFPIWWYTRGAALMGRKCWGSINNYAAILAVGVWIKNIFVPMYGTRDIAGRIISFFVRVAQIIARSLALLIWSILAAAVFVLYLAAPIVAAAGLIINLYE